MKPHKNSWIAEYEANFKGFLAAMKRAGYTKFDLWVNGVFGTEIQVYQYITNQDNWSVLPDILRKFNYWAGSAWSNGAQVNLRDLSKLGTYTLNGRCWEHKKP